MPELIKTQFLYNPEDGALHCHAPTVIALDSGDLLAIWYAYPEVEHKNANLVMARKPAGQKAWEKSKVVLGELSNSCGNPLLFEDPSTGRLWLLFVLLKGKYWNDAQLMGVFSRNSGRTWSGPTVLWKEPGMMIRHPPLRLANGSFLLPAYDERKSRSVLLLSPPGVKHWSESHRFEGLDVIQPVLVRENEQHLNIFFRPTAKPHVVWRSRSGDEGSTWSDPVRTALPNPLTGIAAFAFDGKMALVNNHTEKHQRHPLSLTVSADGGVTWSDPWHFEDVTLEVCYPSFICDDAGLVHGVYTYNRRMIKYVCFDSKELG